MSRPGSSTRIEVHEFSHELLEELESQAIDSFDDEEIIVLPRLIEDGEGWYPSDYIYTVKELRHADFKARFLHDQDRRRFLDEHSAAVAWTIFLGVSANLSTEGLKVLWTYIAATVAKKMGRHEKVPVRLEIARLRRPGLKIDGLVIEGQMGPELRDALAEVVGGEIQNDSE